VSRDHFDAMIRMKNFTRELLEDVRRVARRMRRR
jgi:hypothetical protein